MKYNELKPGMLIKGLGLVTEVSDGNDKLWNGIPNVGHINSDAYHGVCFRATDHNEEFEEAHAPGSAPYIKELNRIREELMDHLDNIQEWLALIAGFREGSPQ